LFIPIIYIFYLKIIWVAVQNGFNIRKIVQQYRI
jgi:hypothetical protein